jgi:GT2 family glycosyltransferase
MRDTHKASSVKTEISIVIPFLIVDEETIDMTKKCLVSFEPLHENDEEILVDDGSWFRHPFNTSVKHPRNYGNAKAWNSGLEKSKGEYILFSDNDIEAAEWREPMLKEMENSDIVFPVVYMVSNATKKRHFAGEFFLVKREIFDAIGNFNEEYGSYFEDTDFFMRAQIAGYRFGIAENAFVVHKSKGTFNKIMTPTQQDALFRKNKELYESLYRGQYPVML